MATPASNDESRPIYDRRSLEPNKTILKVTVKALCATILALSAATRAINRVKVNCARKNKL
jgi:hypothetical protein